MNNLQTKFAALTLSTLILLTAAYAQITPSADAYTNTAAPTTNYGANVLLDVDGATQISYIQFNVSSIPASASVSEATLKLYVNDTLPCLGGNALIVQRLPCDAVLVEIFLLVFVRECYPAPQT